MFGPRSHLSLFLPPSHVIGRHLVILPSHPIHAAVARVCRLQRPQIYNFNTLIRWTKKFKFVLSVIICRPGVDIGVVVAIRRHGRHCQLGCHWWWWWHGDIGCRRWRWSGGWVMRQEPEKTIIWLVKQINERKNNFYLLCCKPKIFFRHVVNIVNGDGRR